MTRETPLGDNCSDDEFLRRALDHTDRVASTELEDAFSVVSAPTRIGQYHIKREIASGGMGIVYEALQEKPRRTVAVKLMRSGIASRSALRRFDYESQLLARLRHSGIAQVYDAGTHRDGHVTVPYFAMEYIVGAKPVTVYAREKKLSVRERLQLFSQVCEAVHHGHQKGIIHRDLKPSNILVDSSGQVKIIDFGVARSTDSDLAVTTLQTNVGQLIGTLQYMSPEQCATEPQDIDTRSDVYSLGVVLYELLCERRPYELGGAAIHEATRVIREHEPARLSKFNRALRGDVDTIVLKALEKDRDRRYRSCVELSDDLGRFLRNEPISARPASAMYQFRKLVSRHKAPFAFVGVLFLMVSAFGVWMSVLYSQADQLRQHAVAAEKEQARARSTLETVTEFQQSMLSEIDAYSMGNGIIAHIRDSVLKSMQDNEVDPPRLKQALASFDRLVGDINATDVALNVIDEDVLGRAAETIQREFAEQPLIRAALWQTVAQTYREIGLYERAMPLQEACLQTRLKELGEDHYDTLGSISNMGALLYSMGRYTEALPYFEQALEGRRRLLGDDHHNTLTSINFMGALLEKQGKLVEAEPYYIEALEGRRRVLGDENPQTLATIDNMGLLLKAQGKLDSAESFLREATRGYRRVLGHDHPSTLFSVANMGDLLMAMGKFKEAAPYYREALAGRRRVLGDEHPHTLGIIDNMGELLHAMGRYEEAVPFLREALAGRRKVLGDAHESTVEGAGNLGALLTDLGRFDEAVALISASEAAARSVYVGGNARWLGNHLRKLGAARVGKGSFVEAEETLLEAHEILVKGFGEHHPRTVKCVNQLIKLYAAWHEAEPTRGFDTKHAEWRSKLAPDAEPG